MERDWTVLRVVVNSENTRTVVRGWTALWVVANLGNGVSNGMGLDFHPGGLDPQ